LSVSHDLGRRVRRRHRGPGVGELQRALAHEYLGEEIGDAYLEARAGAETVTITLRPQRWRTTDYGKEQNPAGG
jgi:hypothetical protein